MSNNPNNLLVLFQRPKEPMSRHKTIDKQSVGFDMPAEFSDAKRFVGLSTRLAPAATRTIKIEKLDKLPNLAFANKVSRDGAFSLFLDKHIRVAGQLIEVLMQPATVDELMSLAVYVRDRVNPYMFQYALSVVIQHRADTRNLDIPSFLTTMPDHFVDPKVMPELKMRTATFEADENLPLEIPREYTASDREEEHLLAYFREDIGVNLHHWHWHLVYPTRGPIEVVSKDRRGELFYYMHNQIMSRYNVARICEGLSTVVPLNNWREPVPEAYFPKIIRSSNNRAYPARAKDSYLRDLDRIDSDTKLEISDLERWRDRILEAIDRGYAEHANGERVPLDEFSGIDLLGNMVEPSDLSVNMSFYGRLHNSGHNLISYVHDPYYKHLEDYGVMGDVATAVRDPVFYRWHGFVDGIFQKHKDKLPSYSAKQLEFDGVTLQDVIVQQTSNKNAAANNLLTCWTKSTVDLEAGLDFNEAGNVYAQFTHLNHAPFEYQITVDNASGEVQRGTCRIFCCPKYNERGNPLSLRSQRLLMIEMDKWSVVLEPGRQTIGRRSCESNVIIPAERTFRSVQAPDKNVDQYRFCSCGWPEHMLVPKGTLNGKIFNLFAMVSNGADDDVKQEDATGECNDAHVFCGIRDKLYPDKRNMGFPFDRNFVEGLSLQGLVELYGNMQAVEIKIKHADVVIDKFTC